jgi:ribosomal protein L7/L12
MTGELEVARLRTRVTHLEGQVAFLYKHLALDFVPERELTDDPKVVEQLKKGNLLAAIAAYRQITDASLEDARQAVEEIQGRLGL